MALCRNFKFSNIFLTSCPSMHDESQALFGLAGTSNAALGLDEDSKH